jgi:ABC-2 type transport system permease protein
MNARRTIALVAWREIRERLRSRVFLYSTLLMLAVVGASSALPSLIDTTRTYRVGVVAPAPPELGAALQRAAKPFHAEVELEALRGPAARRQLNANEVDAVVDLQRDRLAFHDSVDSKLAAIADTAVRAVRHRLPPAPELTAVTIDRAKPSSEDAEALTAMLGASLLMATLAVYGQWVLTGVVEEKANRVVEVVIAAVRPRHLLAGKVIGIGLLGLVQVALIGGLAAILLAAGVFDAPTSLGGSVALVIPWFALGFALYAVAYAAAGAIASRTQDANSAGMPVTYTLLGAFFLGYVVLMADENSALAHVLTVFPLTAPFVLPARSALGGVAVWEHALAILAVVATVYALVRLAGRIYGAGLLRSGPRLDLGAALRSAVDGFSHPRKEV